MDSGNSLVSLLDVDKNGNLDFGCGNHLDVDILLVKCLEHLGSGTGMCFHTCADNGNLCNGCVADDAVLGKVEGILDDAYCKLAVCLCNGEGDILRVVSADRLKDDIYVDILSCKLSKKLESNTGCVGNTDN